MNKRTILIRTYIVLLVVGIAFAVFPTDWSDLKQIIAFIATFLGFILAGISLIIPNNYSHVISKNDWNKKDEEGYTYVILGKRHGMGKHNRVTVYQKNDEGKYSVCGVGVNTDEKGNIKIESNLLIDCKVIIS